MDGPNRLEELVNTYETTLYRAALAILGDAHEAGDAVQDAFLRCLEKAPDFESPAHARAWLLRVTINRCKSFFRSAWQRKTTGLEDDFPDTPFTPDETAVVEAVNRLPKKYRQVIYLYYIEGYATGEIAAILEMPQNTVLSQLARARKLLKTALKGEFDDV